MRISSIILLLAFCNCCIAQQVEQTRISLDLKNATIEAVVSTIEKQAPVHFFYDSTQLKSATFTISGNNLLLQEVLSSLFDTINIAYSIYQSRYIFLTPDQPVYTRYSQLQKRSTDTIRQMTTSESVQLAGNANKMYEIGSGAAPSVPKLVSVAGYVRDEKTGEPISGASVQSQNPQALVFTDDFGYFTLNVLTGRQTFRIQSLGMNDLQISALVHSEGKIDFELSGKISTLRGVTISAEKMNNLKSTTLGFQKIDIKTIRQVPVVFGEADVLRVVTTLPGVKTIGEASTGLNVRGGSVDQNLVLFNDATLYNPSHFFGMFSAFNPEVVNDAVLYKSSMPARFGGRLSSVLDISSRQGNKKKFAGRAGIGLLTSRLMLEGPIDKDKTSFIVAGRSSYANWLLNLLPTEYSGSKASFFDVNVFVTHNINKRNDIYFTAYASDDKFHLNKDTAFNYANRNVAVKWKHEFDNKLNVVTTTGIDHYDFAVKSTRNPVNAYKLKFNINQYYLKSLFTWYGLQAHTIDFGYSVINYDLSPGTYSPQGKESLVQPDEVQKERALESAIHISDNWNVTDHLAIETGIRMSMFNSLGPRSVRRYASGLPKNDDNIIGTESYSKGKFIKTYGGPEFRLSLRQTLNAYSSIKAGFNTQRQYLHMMSNTSAMAPTDIWKLSDPNIRPQHGKQFSVGYYRNLKSNTVELSLEFYYRMIRNYLDYKSGASLVMNHNLEQEVITTKGRAYGAELLIRKTAGKLNGWIGYTYSRIMLRQDDPAAGEVINDGKVYPASYDKPHDVTVVANYKVNHRFSASLNTVYNTGRPITVPVGRFYYSGAYRTIYGDRNGYRIPDYFRVDLSMNIEGNHRVKQRTHNSWTLGVYNLTGRKNPYSVYYVSQNGEIRGYKMSIFGSCIPFISFNIRFE